MARYKIAYQTGSDYQTSVWSGGTTTEIGISPEGSRYANRDFLWRISSATVELEESTFTALPDYNRIIMTLEGDIDLCHNEGEWIHLQPFEPHVFDGGDDTVSRGKVVDFNLMLRKGKAGGALSPLTFDESPEEEGGCGPEREYTLTLERECDVVLYCHSGQVTVVTGTADAYVLQKGASIHAHGNMNGATWRIQGFEDAKAVLATVYKL